MSNILLWCCFIYLCCAFLRSFLLGVLFSYLHVALRSPRLQEKAGWLLSVCFHYVSRDMTKPTKWHIPPAKTQSSLGIRPVWSESSLSAWRKLGSLATHWAHSEDSDQTGRMPRLIWVVPGRTVTSLVLSCRGSWVFSLYLQLSVHW